MEASSGRCSKCSHSTPWSAGCRGWHFNGVEATSHSSGLRPIPFCSSPLGANCGEAPSRHSCQLNRYCLDARHSCHDRTCRHGRSPHSQRSRSLAYAPRGPLSELPAMDVGEQVGLALMIYAAAVVAIVRRHDLNPVVRSIGALPEPSYNVHAPRIFRSEDVELASPAKNRQRMTGSGRSCPPSSTRYWTWAISAPPLEQRPQVRLLRRLTALVVTNSSASHRSIAEYTNEADGVSSAH